AHTGYAPALTTVSAFVIGYGAWGNEADYWRYSRTKLSQIVIPLAVSIGIGQIVFPLTGWILAHLTGITDYAAASALMTRYAFGGASWIAAVVLVVTYFALNDANLYAAINGIENLRQYPRKRLTLLLTIAGAIVAAVLSRWSNSFEAVASMSSTVLPCATVIMLAEWYIISRIEGTRPDFSRIPSLAELPFVRWSAVVALLAGSTVGVVTAGFIPGLERFHLGVCALQSWLSSFVVYMSWRAVELRLCRKI
ncbi:MAG: hypothetical protein ACRD3W_11220, partial [Terriglobales bacterium]